MRSLFLFLALSVASIGATKAHAQTDTTKPTLWLIGDSTVNNGTKGQQGWGTALPQFFDTSKINIVNKARGGRSSRTYFTEGLWDGVLKEMKAGDFVLMQFGHNDGGATYTGDRGRSSIKGFGEETKDVTHADGKAETVHSYGWYLRRYVTDAKAKGATPIVVSLIPRNRRDEAGKIGVSTDYAVWAKEVAAQEKVPFLDLYGRIVTKYPPMSKEEVDALFFGDWTHTSPEGAKFNAQTVVEGLKDIEGKPFAPYFAPATP